MSPRPVRFLSLLLPLAVQALAQGPPAGLLVPGARARVTIAGQTGSDVVTIQRISAESLYVQLARATSGSGVALARSGISRLEISAGRGSHGSFGALVGIAAGGALGGVVASNAWTPCSGLDCMFHLDRGTLTAVGIGAGALLGGFIVRAIDLSSRRERWVEVTPTVARAVVVPLPRGRLGIGADVSFSGHRRAR